jgi:hypothetical protein
MSSLEQSLSTPQMRFSGTSLLHFSSRPILVGARVEGSAASFRITRKLGALISQAAGGSTLLLDYGTEQAVGDSFRVLYISFNTALIS